MLLLPLVAAHAKAATISTNFPPVSSPLPDVSFSVVRVFGALTLVLGLFLAAVWIVRNWRRVVLSRSGRPQLQLLEMRALGHRHVLYVIGYQQQRLLLAASPGGVSLVSHLPSVDPADPSLATVPPVDSPPFVETLQQMLQRKP